MTKTATLISKRISPTGADARLYRLSEPIVYNEPYDDADEPAETTDHVIVSAVVAFYSGPETYIFPAKPDGDVIDYGELVGSFQGGLDHEQALRGAGYEVR